MPVPPFFSQGLRMQPGDITITPASGSEYFIGIVSPDWRSWSLLCVESTWPLALRKACLHGVVRKRRVLASRRGEVFEVADPEHIWISPKLSWHPFDESTVTKEVPELPGVYMLRSMTPVLLGETLNLRVRLLYHLTQPEPCLHEEPPTQLYYQVHEQQGVRATRLRELLSWWEPTPCGTA